MHWIYWASGGSFAVGYYAPSGGLITITTGLTEVAAQARVAYLNGNNTPA